MSHIDANLLLVATLDNYWDVDVSGPLSPPSDPSILILIIPSLKMQKLLGTWKTPVNKHWGRGKTVRPWAGSQAAALLCPYPVLWTWENSTSRKGPGLEGWFADQPGNLTIRPPSKQISSNQCLLGPVCDCQVCPALVTWDRAGYCSKFSLVTKGPLLTRLLLVWNIN